MLEVLIRKQGIEPDITVDLSVGADLLAPMELDELTVAELLASEDKQLLEALEELNALPVVSAEEGFEQVPELEDVVE